MSEKSSTCPAEYYRLFIEQPPMAMSGRERFKKDGITPCIYFAFKTKKLRFDFVDRKPFGYDNQGQPNAFESIYKLGEIE